MDSKGNNKVYLLVVVAALGYFVDLYDLILFNVVKKASLSDLGFTGKAYEDQEIFLFNMQMVGMLLGGLLWGILGDKKGRISVLFGSIVMYSLANLANGFIQHLDHYAIHAYAILRFLAGIGLAGELGAGITLVAENMEPQKRGIGTMIIVTFGALGAVTAALVGGMFHWSVSYIIGGVMGLLLLLLRVGTYESGMFTQVKADVTIHKGDFKFLLTHRPLLVKYLKCIAIGLPIWFVIGILINLSARFIQAANATITSTTADAVMYAYIGLSAGDLLSGLLSQALQSRKKVVVLYLIFTVVLVGIYCYALPNLSNFGFKGFCFALGLATGYWAIFVTIAAEQFGTNLRATVTTTVPNMVRGAVVPITLSFKLLQDQVGTLQAAIWVGVACLLLAFWGITGIKESFGKSLNFIDQKG